MFTDFKTKRAKGFSLVEMMISVGIGSIVLGGLAAMTLYTARSFAALANYVELDNSSRRAVDRMTTDLRQVDFMLADGFKTSPPEIRLSWNTNRVLSYKYIPGEKKLYRTDGNSAPQVLLSECDPLPGIPIFQVFQRNTISNTFNQYPAATDSYEKTAKVIQISWICKRRVIGQYNTESVQTAKIVLRNQ